VYQFISEYLWPLFGASTQEEFAGRCAGVLSITVGYGWYIHSILREKDPTKPPVLAWVILTAVSVVMLATFIGAGGGETRWIPVSNLAGAFIVLGLAIKNRIQGKEEEQEPFKIREYISCALAAVALFVFWFFTDRQAEAFYLVLVGEVLALSIILENVWHNPREENPLAWWGTATSNLINFWAIASMVDWVYVSVTGTMDALIFTLAFAGYIKERFWPSPTAQ
jgi:hypothetical protein